MTHHAGEIFVKRFPEYERSYVVAHECICSLLVEVVPGTSVDKPSMADVLDVFDPEDVEVADALEVVQAGVMVRARVASENNLGFDGEVVARGELVVD